ncbi:MAG: hypothetical protein F6J87_14840 [Spirulina sp. SIO3F2]|nr:hypothetical protein [Spirulina sp. SIO3F2]
MGQFPEGFFPNCRVSKYSSGFVDVVLPRGKRIKAQAKDDCSSAGRVAVFSDGNRAIAMSGNGGELPSRRRMENALHSRPENSKKVVTPPVGTLKILYRNDEGRLVIQNVSVTGTVSTYEIGDWLDPAEHDPNGPNGETGEDFASVSYNITNTGESDEEYIVAYVFEKQNYLGQIYDQEEGEYNIVYHPDYTIGWILEGAIAREVEVENNIPLDGYHNYNLRPGFVGGGWIMARSQRNSLLWPSTRSGSETKPLYNYSPSSNDDKLIIDKTGEMSLISTYSQPQGESLSETYPRISTNDTQGSEVFVSAVLNPEETILRQGKMDGVFKSVSVAISPASGDDLNDAEGDGDESTYQRTELPAWREPGDTSSVDMFLYESSNVSSGRRAFRGVNRAPITIGSSASTVNEQNTYLSEQFLAEFGNDHYYIQVDYSRAGSNTTTRTLEGFFSSESGNPSSGESVVTEEFGGIIVSGEAPDSGAINIVDKKLYVVRPLDQQNHTGEIWEASPADPWQVNVFELEFEVLPEGARVLSYSYHPG